MGIVINEKEMKIQNISNGNFKDINIYEWIRNYRFEYLYALINGFNNNLDIDLMCCLVTNLNYLYKNPNASSWQKADDLTSLYIYLGLYGEMAIIEDYNSMISLWNDKLREIYKDMLIKIKEICLINEDKTVVILDLYRGLNTDFDKEKGPIRMLSRLNIGE